MPSLAHAFKKEEVASFSPSLPIILCLTCTFFVSTFLIDHSYVDNASFASQNVFIVGIAGAIYLYIVVTSALLERRLNFFMVFVALSFLFYFGQQTLYAFGEESYASAVSIYLRRGGITERDLFEAGLFSCQSILAMYIGYLAFKLRKFRPSRQKNIDDSALEKKALRNACLVLFWILLIPTLIDLYRNINLTMTIGYGERIMSGESSSGIFNILSSMMPYVLIGLVLTKKEGERWQYILIIAYIALYTMQGSRIRTFVLIGALLIIQLSCFPWKSRVKQGAFYLAIGVVAAIGFTLVSSVRQNVANGLPFFEAVFSSFADKGEDGFVSSLLGEAGSTIAVLAAVLRYCPSPVPFAYGASYLSGAAYVLPNALNGNVFAEQLSVDEVFAGFLTQSTGIGSSFVAEGYYNFGFFSLALFALFGIGFSWLCRTFDACVSGKKIMMVFICSAIFLIVLFYIRSDTRTFFRNAVWFVVPIYLFARVLYMRMRPQHKSE